MTIKEMKNVHKAIIGFVLVSVVMFGYACNDRSPDQKSKQPNVLWIVMDDVGTEVPFFGHKISTPNIDRLIKEGTIFRQAFVTAPVCSPARSAMITGMYQTTIGAHNHVSSRGEHHIQLPNYVKMVPQIFKENGYYVTNGDYPIVGDGLGKADYNFEWNESIYDGNDWRKRKPGQPFFAQIQLLGGKNRDKRSQLQHAIHELGSSTGLDSLLIPPYYPKDSVILQDWADYMDCIRYTDKQIGEILDRLKEDGELDNTLIILMGDNGVSHARGKQFLYDEGVKVLFVARGPGIEEGKVREDMIEHIDMAPISLAAVGIQVPEWMQGKDVFSKEYTPRKYVYGARDRCGETVDRIRSVRSDRYKYIRNFYPDRPHLQPSNYKDSKKIIQRLRELHDQNKLAPVQEALLFAERRPEEELYDLLNDPYEMVNLAQDNSYGKVLQAFRNQLTTWSKETHDPAPESFEIYTLEMKNQWERTPGEKAKERVARNIEEYKKWMQERATNQ